MSPLPGNLDGIAALRKHSGLLRRIDSSALSAKGDRDRSIACGARSRQDPAPVQSTMGQDGKREDAMN